MTYTVMTVCTGNICRSPMAEIVLRDRMREAGLDGEVAIDSSGISDEERGNSIDRRAHRVLSAAGYEDDALMTHRAHQITVEEVRERDLILVMTAHHARVVRSLAARAGVNESKVRMYREFDSEVDPTLVAHESELDVEDPWYGGMQDFEACLEQVEAGADGVVAYVRGQLSD